MTRKLFSIPREYFGEIKQKQKQGVRTFLAQKFPAFRGCFMKSIYIFPILIIVKNYKLDFCKKNSWFLKIINIMSPEIFRETGCISTSVNQ